MSIQNREMDTDEFRIIEEILNGKGNKYKILIDRYSPMVFHIVYGFEKDREEANELAQQIFVKIYEKLGSYNGKAKFSSWLYSLAINHCRDYAKNIRRNNSRFSELEQGFIENQLHGDADPHETMETRETGNMLYKAIDKLTEEYAMPLLMKYRDGLSYEVMSERLDVSVSALKVRVHRARKELKSLIEESEP